MALRPLLAFSRWAIAPDKDTSPEIAAHLTRGLYSSIPIFLGGVFNTIAVAAACTLRNPTPLFVLWLALEIAIGSARLAVIVAGRRAQRLGKSPPTTLAVLLSCAWAGSVGFGAYISIASEDWLVATVTALSATGMVSGICLRNYGTPRLVTLMMVLSLVPCAVAAALASERILLLVSIQLPIFMVAIGFAAFQLNRIMVGRMTAQDALEKSEAFNRSILESSPDYTIILDRDDRIMFCHVPQIGPTRSKQLIGVSWLDMLPSESRDEGRQALQYASDGQTARLTIANTEHGKRRWFDLAISSVSDGSGRTLVVARDISHQKKSEEHALWMANHDPLTGLPNRVVLQDFLDRRCVDADSPADVALLVLDIDNFKLINDTLGHDAGDALLCAFAEKLRKAVRAEDLVARLGGDEFAIVLHARSDEEIVRTAEKIFAELRCPFPYDNGLIECNASIGASLYPRDGTERSELMKAADIALYSAKSNGRGHLKIFENAMRNDMQSRNSMVYLARRALEADGLLPYYQPKVALGNGEIVGFEALLRWRDSAGNLRLPDKLRAAFDDPGLSEAISGRMIDQTFADVRDWLDQGIAFGHVAINAAAAEFRQGRFAESLLEKLQRQGIPTSRIQIEVTETVFLGRGADHVERALRQLNGEGVRIALDDFGTGYASLSHLMQFPVDVLKIDRSFVRGIGRNADAEAITRTVINLGQSMDVEVVAEGVESAEQEAYLIRAGCDTAQGYLYSRALPARSVPEMLARREAKSA